MKLIKQLNNFKPVSEDAAGGAVGGGAVASVVMPLFSTLVKQHQPAPVVEQPKQPKKAKKKKSIGLAEAMQALTETNATSAAPDFDASQVLSKLKAIEDRERQGAVNVVTFGLEDDAGNIVRVSVSQEQASDFERALQSLQSQSTHEGETQMEIAEILFKLRNQFEFIDVQWPDVVEDEEQDIQLDVDGQPGAEGEVSDPNLDLDAAPPAGMESPDQVSSLLTQVIDMMKADAEARKAEARAREAEAKTKEADAIVAQSMARVKQEEQYLDMETYNKAKKEEEREAKRLAQLARWKHEMSQGGGEDFDGSTPLRPADSVPEEEEKVANQSRKAKPRVAPHDIAQFIIGRIK